MVRGEERWLAGVCGAISTRTGLDPLIVRGILVVAGVLGAPVVLFYVVAWVLLPNAANEIVVERLFQGHIDWRGIVAIVLVALLLGGGSWGVFSLAAPSGWSWPVIGGLWTLILIGGVVALIVAITNSRKPKADPSNAHPSTGDASTGDSGSPTAPSAAFSGDPSAASAGYSHWADQASATTAQWVAVEKEKHRRSAAPASVTLILLGLVLLVGALAGLAYYWSGGTSSVWYPDTLIAGAAVTTAASGLVMVVLGILGWRAGSFGALAVIASLTVFGAVAIPTLPGEIVIAATTSNAGSGNPTEPTVVFAGTANFDAGLLPSGATKSISVLAGNATITIPEAGQYVVHSRTVLGNTSIVGDETSEASAGVSIERTVIIREGAIVDAVDSTHAVTTLTLTVALGNAKISID